MAGGSPANIRGLPESCIKNVTLHDVNIESGEGIDLLHMTGTFINVASASLPPNLPFRVEENVTATAIGTTPAISSTPPLTDQIACS
jgi:hypothetical protein